MKEYKALISFCGKICMAKGQVQSLSDEDSAPLLVCGYIELVEKKTKAKAETKKSEHK